MNQQSDDEFELAQSTDGSTPPSKGASPVAPTAVVPADDVPALISQPPPPELSEINSQQCILDAANADGSTEISNLMADRPLIADEHNTVISTQLESANQPYSGPSSASAEELQNRLFGPRDNRQGNRSALRIGNMEVYEEIGAGGMGAVFRAVDIELSREVALKVLHPRVAADPALVDRFRNEARACAQLNHDNIARVFNAGDHEGVHYIAYEYADGQTLKQLIDQRGQLTTAETVNYAIQATLALGHIESAGIIHRDIKPSNIILTKNGRIKVVDLGLARRDTEDSIADLTVAGTTLGTFDYLAPEQARDARAADIRSDIYSLGCSLFHMLAGRPPYPEGTAVQKMLDHQGKDPPDIRQKNSQVIQPLAEIIQRMMMTSPADRYQAPGQLLADLIHLADQMGLRSVPAEGIVWRRVPVTKVRDLSGNLFLAAAIAMICVTALVLNFIPAHVGENSNADVQQWLFPNAGQTDTPPTNSTQQQNSSQQQNLSQPEPSIGLENRTDQPPDEATAETVVALPAPEQPTKEPDTTVEQTADIRPFLLRGSTEPTRYRSLGEAWDKAVDGDTIELDFDGAAPEVTTPLPRRSVGQASPRIAIRAARDRKPVLRFAVRPEAVSSTSQGRFFELSSDLQLEISGVHFQIDLSSATQRDDDWTLFDFRGFNRVRMNRCTVDVTNTGPIPLSLFRLRDGGSADSQGDTASVELESVAVRGSTDLVRLQTQMKSEVTLEQSGFAINGSIVRNVGSTEMLIQGSMLLTMNHCTTISAQPFIVADSTQFDDIQPDTILPQLDIVSDSNVFAALDEDGILVSMRGNSYQDEQQELLTWYGTNNYYNDKLVVFWGIESGLSDSDPLELDLDSWQIDWNRQADTQEKFPKTFGAEVWSSARLLTGRSAASLNELPVSVFELKSTSFSTSGGGQFSLEKGQKLPGVNTYELKEFPSSIDRRSSAADLSREDARLNE